MKQIRIFLASSNELKPERDNFEIEIYRKCKTWFDRGIFLYLDIWEDLSARMGANGSQSEYDKKVKSADLFVLLGYTKLGMYTAEEFDNAIGQFKATDKPFIFTYFKNTTGPVEDSLTAFKDKLYKMGHFISPFTDSNDLWNQFNKELDRLDAVSFTKNEHPEPTGAAAINVTGNSNNVISGNTNSTVTVNTGNTSTQTADKIYNINSIDSANFS